MLRPGVHPPGGLLFALALALTGCINWADAPFMERAETLSPEGRELLTSASPEAGLVSAVYRLHMETGRRGYVVVSTQFLFEDTDGQIRHGMIDRSGTLITRKAAFPRALPKTLEAKLMQEPNAPLAGAALVAGPWTYSENGRKTYQFEFTHGGRRGLCTTDPEGANRQVHFFPAASP